jgi:hypothetical protein
MKCSSLESKYGVVCVGQFVAQMEMSVVTGYFIGEYC